jgi:peptidoglycan/LPS O-acetylase OafA/YrhL
MRNPDDKNRSSVPSDTGSSGKTYLYSLVTLRGLFVMLVCLFHFMAGAALYVECYDCVDISYRLAMPACYGFFILSGFGITWSLHLSNYKPSFAGTFYLKRLTRLEPPYLLSIIVILLVQYLFSLWPEFGGSSFHIHWMQIGLHLGYLTAFSHYEWLNPAFWTLAVEFQYYLLAAWLFPLFKSPDWRFRNAAMVVLMGTYYLFPHAKHTLNTYMPLFLIGIVLFQHRSGVGTLRERVLWLAWLVLTTLSYKDGFVVIGIAVLCISMLLKDDHYSAVGNFFGEISYSIYLLHTIVAIAVLKLLHNYSSSLPTKLVAIAACYALTVTVAYVFYVLVERPSHRVSQRIRYRGTQADQMNIESASSVAAGCPGSEPSGRTG